MLGDEWWRQVLWVDIGSPFLWHAGYSQESFEFMDKVWVKVAKVAMPGSNGSHIFFLSLTCTVFHTPIIIGLTWNRGSFPCYIEFSVTYWKWLIWSIRKSLECIYTVWLFVLSSSLPLCFLSLSLSLLRLCDLRHYHTLLSSPLLSSLVKILRREKKA